MGGSSFQTEGKRTFDLAKKNKFRRIVKSVRKTVITKKPVIQFALL